MTKEAFGPNLRRLRLQQGITLGQIAEATKVPVAMWQAFERNDLSEWPFGVYARAYVREYARIVGADPDATVDEFCRWFPNGDRRFAPIAREQAAIVGHELEWEDTPPTGEERRAELASVRPSRADALRRAVVTTWAAFWSACLQAIGRSRRTSE
jgi:transcriptional regulator with XRE-family HTH domain